jgi:hypothetical protein
MHEYVALVESPRALPDDLILVFHQPAKDKTVFQPCYSGFQNDFPIDGIPSQGFF